MRLLLLLACCCLAALPVRNRALGEEPAPRAPEGKPEIKPVKIEGGYAVVTSAALAGDKPWQEVAEALAGKYGADIVTFKTSVAEVQAELARRMPRYVCFVARPEEAGRNFVVSVHRLMRRLDGDPYTDALWGILTGYSAADAMKSVAQNEPLVIRKAAAGTGIPLEAFDEGVWYSEGEAGVYHQKSAGGKAERKTGAQDSTRALVDAFNVFQTDLFLTSGHATERDWQIGYSYKNGQFRCKDGVLFGVDLDRKTHAIQSPNPKVYLPVGNCLMGHVKDKQSMALAFMGSAGVRQMIGYTVSTWYGYGGWGVKDYFLGQPGRFTLAESFFLNNQALMQRLEAEFPGKQLDLENYNMETDPKLMDGYVKALGYAAWNETAKTHLGLLWDRDTVALYGDPAWDARLAPRELAWKQALTEKDGTFTFELTALKDAASGRPPAAFLPRRIAGLELLEGKELEPLITDTFILLPKLTRFEKDKTYKVVFKAKNSGF